MLRIEVYPVMAGLLLTATITRTSPTLGRVDGEPARVSRAIPTETIESVGTTEALRDAVVDLFTLYPALIEGALQ